MQCSAAVGPSMVPFLHVSGQSFQVLARTGKRFHRPASLADQLLDPLAALRSGGPPLLVIHGENDEAVSTDDAEMYAKARTDAELTVLESPLEQQLQTQTDSQERASGGNKVTDRIGQATSMDFRHRITESTDARKHQFVP